MAENVCDLLNEFFFGTSADVEGFRPALVANCVFNSFLCYTTIILNIVTIHAIRKTALLPKPLRTLLLSLAASDVGVGLLVQPLYISTLVSRLNQKRIDCISYKGLLAVINFFCASSLFNVVTISVDRFLAVHLHLRYQELVTHKRVIAAVISIWLFSAIISSECPLGFIAYHLIKSYGSWLWLFASLSVVIVYWRIYIVLKRHKNQIQGLQISRSTTGSSKWRLIKLFEASKVSSWNILCLCIVFLICYLPSIYSLFFSNGSPFKSNLFTTKLRSIQRLCFSSTRLWTLLYTAGRWDPFVALLWT